MTDIEKTIAEIEAALSGSLSVNMSPAGVLFILGSELGVLKACTDEPAANEIAENVRAFCEQLRKQNWADTSSVTVPLFTGQFSPQSTTAWKENSSRFVQPVIGDSGGVQGNYADTRNVPTGGANLGNSGIAVTPEISKSDALITIEKMVEVAGKIEVQMHEILKKDLPDELKPKGDKTPAAKSEGDGDTNAAVLKSGEIGWCHNMNSPEFLNGTKPDPLDDFSLKIA